MIRCVITDRRWAGGTAALLRALDRAMADGVEWVQIREKDLSTRALTALTREVLGVRGGRPVRVLVNTRVDVALAAGADGVHLPGRAPRPAAWRRLVPPGFLLGVACHDLNEVKTAAADGADYALYSPILASPGKGTPLGWDALALAARTVRLPVLALGGIGPEHLARCAACGAAGAAGIRHFLEPYLDRGTSTD